MVEEMYGGDVGQRLGGAGRAGLGCRPYFPCPTYDDHLIDDLKEEDDIHSRSCRA